MLTMKLYFNEDVTPVDYHPQGFMESKGDDFVYEDETVNIKVTLPPVEPVKVSVLELGFLQSTSSPLRVPLESP